MLSHNNFYQFDTISLQSKSMGQDILEVYNKISEAWIFVKAFTLFILPYENVLHKF